MIPLAANQFDLSVASILGIAQVLANGLHAAGPALAVAAVLCILLGAFVGLVNGLLVTRVRINSFIATLGTGTLLLASTTGTRAASRSSGLLPADFVALSGKIGASASRRRSLYVLIVGLVLWIVFDYLPLGRYLYVIGDSPRAAELNGISATRYVTLGLRRLRHARGLRRRRPAGAAAGRPEHGRPGTDAAGLHRRAARRDRRSGPGRPMSGARCWRSRCSPSRSPA